MESGILYPRSPIHFLWEFEKLSLLVTVTVVSQLIEITSPSTVVLPVDEILDTSQVLQWLQVPDTKELLTNVLEVLEKLPKGECTNQFVAFINAATNREEWALKMLDATSKPQSGILMGNVRHIGNYDECLQIDENRENQRIQGKYCTSIFEAHKEFGENLGVWLSIKGVNKKEDGTHTAGDILSSYGFCVPKVCSVEILQNMSNVLEDLAKSPLHFNFVDKFCDGREPLPYTSSAITAIVAFSIFGALMIWGTFYDFFIYRKMKDAEKRPDFFVAFSVLANGEKLFAAKSTTEDLSCLNSLRVISMVWVVLGHTFQYVFTVPHINSLEIPEEWKNRTENVVIIAAEMSVDTFFVIGGLLVVYITMRNKSKSAKFSLPMFYIHRILRLTPALAMIILLTATLLPHMGNGPFWKPVVREMYQEQCEKNWWATLIYLQNYLVLPQDRCISQAWYLAVDSQMYFLSPLIIFPLIKWPKYSIGAIIVFVVLNCSYIFEVTFKKELGATVIDQKPEFFELLYFRTHIRGVAYLIGMICGYIIYKTRTSEPIKLSKFHVIVLWTLSLSLLLGILFSHHTLAKEYDVLSAAFLNALKGVGWSIAVSIIILLCVNDYGGLINCFLSHWIFTILIRLNYSIYLLHNDMLAVVFVQERTPTYFSNLSTYCQFWGHYIFTVVAAVIWNLAFESPILQIEKIIFGKKKNTDTCKNQNSSSTNKIVEEFAAVHIPNGKIREEATGGDGVRSSLSKVMEVGRIDKRAGKLNKLTVYKKIK